VIVSQSGQAGLAIATCFLFANAEATAACILITWGCGSISLNIGKPPPAFGDHWDHL
jgi:hypothetical protein